jgi:hypothetical protein
MGRFFRVLMVSCVGLLLCGALVWGASRLSGPTAGQEAALTILNRAPARVDRNAFPVLWLMGYDIPPGELAAVFEEDRRFLVKPIGQRPVFDASAAEGRYPRVVFDEQSPMLCMSPRTCLAEIEADPAAAEAWTRRHAALIRRAESLSGYGGIRSGFGHGADAPLPPYQLARASLPAHALAFVQGRTDEAFDRTCHAIVTWRRLGPASDSLIGRLIGASFSSAIHGELFVQMLARTPREQPLPASCAEAFAPLTDAEHSICDAYRGEFALIRDGLMHVPSATDLPGGKVTRWTMPVLYDQDMSEADVAESLAWVCGERLEDPLRADQPIEGVPAPPSLYRFRCIANSVGCVFAEMAVQPEPQLRYAARVQDANARIQVISLLLRLRSDTGDPRPFAERLRDGSEETLHASRKLRTSDDGKSLRMGEYAPGDEERPEWTISLPQYFHAGAPGAPSG